MRTCTPPPTFMLTNCIKPRYARGLISGPGSTLFEELGLYYIGPIDGHNLGDLIGVLRGKGDGPPRQTCPFPARRAYLAAYCSLSMQQLSSNWRHDIAGDYWSFL